MARVSLIPLNSPNLIGGIERLDSIRAELTKAGHTVDECALAHPATPLTNQAVNGIRWTAGDVLVVVDLAIAYTPANVLAVVDRILTGQAPLVIAARRGNFINAPVRRLLGTGDPFSGLVGLTRAAAIEADTRFAPVGNRFACELLGRVGGERAEVLVDLVASPRRRWVPLDDVRHAKRIADERLGTISRLMQFCFVGASGMIVDLTTYAALLALLSRTSLQDRAVLHVVGGSSVTLAQALAALLSIASAIVWNFSLNRRLTFNDARRGSIVHQFWRYLVSNLAGCAVSLAFRLLLPSRIPFFARHRLAAAVTGIIAATGISFTLARWFVFRTRTHQVDVALQSSTQTEKNDDADGSIIVRGSNRSGTAFVGSSTSSLN